MSKLKQWLESKMFWLKTGMELHVANEGKSVDEIVIRYKSYYFSIFLDTETNKPTGDFSWSEDPTMFHTPIREHYTAVKKEKK